MTKRLLIAGILGAAGVLAYGRAGDAPDATPSGARLARLVIHEQRATTPLAIEGSIGFLRVAPVNSGSDFDATRVPTAVPGTRARIFAAPVGARPIPHRELPAPL